MPLIISIALLDASSLSDATETFPSSSTSIVAPVSWIIFFITLPPGPIKAPIFSLSIIIVVILGAYSDNSFLGAFIVSIILFRINSLAGFACFTIRLIRSMLMPSILRSICKAVTPESVPVSFRSISP